jgi:energy-coupling factor transporter ATP-binding protein EcfA2
LLGEPEKALKYLGQALPLYQALQYYGGEAWTLTNIGELYHFLGDEVKALVDADFHADAGEIHALLGENGAGKSTLVKILSGALKPDEGAMTLDGRPYHPADPLDGRLFRVVGEETRPELPAGTVARVVRAAALRGGHVYGPGSSPESDEDLPGAFPSRSGSLSHRLGPRLDGVPGRWFPARYASVQH